MCDDGMTGLYRSRGTGLGRRTVGRITNLGVFGLEFGKTDFGIGLRTSKNIKYDFSKILTLWSKVNAVVSKVNADVMLTSPVAVRFNRSGRFKAGSGPTHLGQTLRWPELDGGGAWSSRTATQRSETLETAAKRSKHSNKPVFSLTSVIWATQHSEKGKTKASFATLAKLQTTVNGRREGAVRSGLARGSR
ncbi:hypothetical protein V6N13_116580 [Hibiscus sabdariffa]